MKADLRSGGGDGPEREELRSFLRQWEVPGPPPEIEQGLRRTFRRRQAKGRRAVWLSFAAAAALVLLAVWWIGVRDRAPAPAPTERSFAAASPLPPPAPPAEAGGPQSSPRGAGVRSVPVARALRRPPPSPREAEVIVEPGQGRLLAELGRRLRDVRQEAPGTSIVRVGEEPTGAPAAIEAGDADVPVYRGEWETMAGEWPYVHRSRPGR